MIWTSHSADGQPALSTRTDNSDGSVVRLTVRRAESGAPGSPHAARTAQTNVRWTSRAESVTVTLGEIRANPITVQAQLAANSMPGSSGTLFNLDYPMKSAVVG